MCPPLSTFLATCDVVECLVNFLSVEDAVALACSTKSWRSAVNQKMIWRLLERREEERRKPNYLRKEYRDYAEKCNDGTLDPLCEEAFVIIYPRFMERSWDDYVRMRCDNVGLDEEEVVKKASWTIDSLKSLESFANQLYGLRYHSLILITSLLFFIFLFSVLNDR